MTLFLLILSGVHVVSNYFTGAGINASVLYHLRAGFAGAGIGEYTTVIVASAAFFLIALGISVLVLHYLYKSAKPVFKKFQFIAIALFIAATVVNPAGKDLFKLYAPRYAIFAGDHSSGFSHLYITPDAVQATSPLNLVFIYLESLERTYLDETLFPGLTPGLKLLEAASLSFTNMEQVFGTESTIAGITASQCGIPLVTPSGGNSMSGMQEFLPGALCIGDMLSPEGYYLDFMGGASLEFAGKGNFFNSHGFATVHGLDEFLDDLQDPGYISDWGIYDDTLFELAQARFEKLAATQQPFGMFLLTLDTHHPRGHISATCGETPYGDGSNSILNAVHCSDLLVTAFVKSIQQSRYAENTLIVIASDHLAMPNTATSILDQGKRRNLFMVLRPDQTHAERITRDGSMLDIGPTLLSLMGLDVPELGFGRDLLRAEPTIVEMFPDADAFLRSQWRALAQLWQFPQLDSGFLADSWRRHVRLGSRTIRMPALMHLDADAGVTRILFEFDSPVSLIDYVAAMDAKQPMIWIDACSKLSVLALNQPIRHKNEDCVAIGRLGNQNILVKAVDDELFLMKGEIKRLIARAEVDTTAYSERIRRLHNMARAGVPDWLNVIMDPSGKLTGGLLVKSSGGYVERSYLERFPQAEGTLKNRVFLNRGLTLVGVTPDAEPVKLAHVDTCDPDNPVEDNVSFSASFADIIDFYQSVFGAYIIAAHDSAICNPASDMRSFFEGLPLEQWRELGLRQPYIGVMAGNGETYEVRDDYEKSVVIHLEAFLAPRHPVLANRSKDFSVPRVAHAGGGYKGQTYTNSLDALDFNARFYELFEIDFSWTLDDDLVCLHDWEHSFQNAFGIQTDVPLTLAAFRKLLQSRATPENCTLETLIEWLDRNRPARIVTDIKSHNVRALELIASRYPDYLHRFVPQIYAPEEYWPVRYLGFEDVIWTLYRYAGGLKTDILQELRYMDLYAVTMPRSRADQGLPALLEKKGLKSYVHTINDPQEARHYQNLGIDEIYTDWLFPQSPSVPSESND